MHPIHLEYNTRANDLFRRANGISTRWYERESDQHLAESWALAAFSLANRILGNHPKADEFKHRAGIEMKLYASARWNETT